MINTNLVCNELYQGHLIEEHQRGGGRALCVLETEKRTEVTVGSELGSCLE